MSLRLDDETERSGVIQPSRVGHPPPARFIDEDEIGIELYRKCNCLAFAGVKPFTQNIDC